MPDIDIRSATVEDCSLILHFIRQLAIYEKLEDEAVATENDIRTSLFGDNPQAEVIIAERTGEPIGFALFFHNYSTFLGRRGLYLEDLFVVPEARGFGAGKALLRSLAKTALERGCGRFEWWVLDWNAPAIEFYKSLGADPMHDWTVFRLTGDALEKLAGD